MYLRCSCESPSQRYVELPTTETPDSSEDSAEPSEAGHLAGSHLPSLQTERSPLLGEQVLPASSSLPSKSGSAPLHQLNTGHSESHKPWLVVLAVGWTVLCIGSIPKVGSTDEGINPSSREVFAALLVGYPASLIISVGFALQFLTINMCTVHKYHSVLSPRTMFLQALASLWLGIRLDEEFNSQPDQAIRLIWRYIRGDEVDRPGSPILVAGRQFYNLLPYIGSIWCSICMAMLLLRYLWLKGRQEGHQGTRFLVKYDQREENST